MDIIAVAREGGQKSRNSSHSTQHKIKRSHVIHSSASVLYSQSVLTSWWKVRSRDTPQLLRPPSQSSDTHIMPLCPKAKDPWCWTATIL
eukprot:4196918-Amphidinium_carterae.1